MNRFLKITATLIPLTIALLIVVLPSIMPAIPVAPLKAEKADVKPRTWVRYGYGYIDHEKVFWKFVFTFYPNNNSLVVQRFQVEEIPKDAKMLEEP